MGDDLIERLKATEGHTPGPWRIRRNRSHNPEECDLTICGDIFLLADVNGPNYSHCEPNARLLALAPEMKARILSDATDLLAARVTVAGRSMTVAELIAAHEREQWQPIETAPRDGSAVWVYAAPRDGLSGFQCWCAWHPDAGWCVDELRIVTHWRPLPEPPAPTETEGA